MQAPNLDPAVLNHFPSDSTFYSASETLLEGIQRLERKTQADLWKPTVPLDSGTRLFWAQWPGTDKPKFYQGPLCEHPTSKAPHGLG